jgi:hypothetical protein
LYPNSVFWFGIGWYFLGIFHTNTEGKLGKAFGIIHLAGTPFSPQKGLRPLHHNLAKRAKHHDNHNMTRSTPPKRLNKEKGKSE